MCGICGYAALQGGDLIRPPVLQEMNDRIAHRGPDGEGFLVVHPPGASPDLPPGWHAAEGTMPVGLAMRRLAIIDLVTGDQPIANEDGTIWIVYNGEAYNHVEWRTWLEERGHRFRTRTDTETVLHLYEEFGEACVSRLNGMFAFAIWDGRRGRLFLARDRVGIKPLHYARKDHLFAFGSEIKPLLAHPALSRELDYQALDDFLRYKFVPSPRTIFREVRRLPAGHTLTVYPDGRVEMRRYWDLTFEGAMPEVRTFAAAQAELRHRLRHAVQIRLMSDVPLGAFLSGGIDSSLIVGLMAELTDRPVQTFSMGFSEHSFDELKYARLVARRFGTDHHEFIVNPQDALDLMHRIVQAVDEPFGDASAIPTYLVSQATRRHVTVALSGMGADEAFAGYERYWLELFSRLYRRVPAWLRQRGVEPLLFSLPVSSHKKSPVERARRVVQAGQLSPEERYLQVISVFGDGFPPGAASGGMRTALYTEEARRRLGDCDGKPLTQDLFARHPEGEFVNRAFYVDVHSILTDDYLVKDDRMSMANSLEVRVPFLDHELLAFAASLPVEWRLRGLTTKYILRRAFRDFLPRTILRRGKYGFEAPIAAWFRGDLWKDVQGLLLGERAQRRGLFDLKYVRHLLERHRAGEENLQRQIWALVMVEIWHQEYIDGVNGGNGT